MSNIRISAQTALNIGSISRSFCLARRPETAHTRHAAVSAPAVGVCKGRRGPMARIVGGCGPCVRRKAARPRRFVRGTSVPARMKVTVSSLTCRRGMAESTAENRRFSGCDRPGPLRGAHPRCLRGGVAWLRRAVCKHLRPYPSEKNKKAIYERQPDIDLDLIISYPDIRVLFMHAAGRPARPPPRRRRPHHASGRPRAAARSKLRRPAPACVLDRFCTSCPSVRP